MQDRFDNLEKIKRATMPTLFIHGRKDAMVSYKHSTELYIHCNGPKQIMMPINMSHNNFDLMNDLIIPMFDFLQKNGITTRELKYCNHVMSIPIKYFVIPDVY